MKKTLLTLTVAGALVVPAGSAFAWYSAHQSAAEVTTRDQERVREEVQATVQSRVQTTDRVADASCDCIGDQLQTQARDQEQLRDQDQVRDVTGAANQAREGVPAEG